MRNAIMGILLLSTSCLFAQDAIFEGYGLEPVQVKMSITNIDGRKALRVARDTVTHGADIPTFVRLKNTDNFSNGTIEVMLLSRLSPTADASARGFIGLAFRINKDNSRFESIYIRPPTEGRTTSSAGTIQRNIFPTLIISSTGYVKKQRENMNPMPTWG